MNGRTKPRVVPLAKIPNKIYYSISEASEYTGVEPHVLRYWETKFSKLNPKRVGGNQRKYTRADLELLYEIVHLLYQEGYTLDGAERKLRTGLAAAKNERQNEKEKEQEEIVVSAQTTLQNIQIPQVILTESIISPSITEEEPGEYEPEEIPLFTARQEKIQEIKRELLELLDLLR